MAEDFDEGAEASKLDSYEETHAVEIEGIVSDLQSRGVPQHALDELVHTAVDNLGEDASEWGSEINNSGFTRQVAFVLQENGRREGRELISKTADEALAEAAPKP